MHICDVPYKEAITLVLKLIEQIMFKKVIILYAGKFFDLRNRVLGFSNF
jgi:hypothetical protein